MMMIAIDRVKKLNINEMSIYHFFGNHLFSNQVVPVGMAFTVMDSKLKNSIGARRTCFHTICFDLLVLAGPLSILFLSLIRMCCLFQ